ncbi:MAG: TIGR04255 family protein [Candidatus Brocadiaceae bacterium]|nr:TIGR04255 family protein [Candidatus Brocadiaceae bacterium]
MDSHPKAPLSELIFGMTLKKPIFGIQGFIFELIHEFKSDYPLIQYGNPLEDLNLQNYILEPQINYNNTGPLLYRLSTHDSKWLVQLQFNKIFFSWIRKDEEEVGNFPGYNAVCGKFSQLVSFAQNKLHGEFPVKFCELTYQDRIIWQEHIDDLSQVDKILKITLPTIKTAKSTHAPNNLFSKYTIPVDTIGGYAIISINTATTKDDRQLLNFQCTLRGSVENMLIDDWYSNANSIQSKLFTDLFNEELLTSWK